MVIGNYCMRRANKSTLTRIPFCVHATSITCPRSLSRVWSVRVGRLCDSKLIQADAWHPTEYEWIKGNVAYIESCCEEQTWRPFDMSQDDSLSDREICVYPVI
jgi:hypothetical protein